MFNFEKRGFNTYQSKNSINNLRGLYHSYFLNRYGSVTWIGIDLGDSKGKN